MKALVLLAFTLVLTGCGTIQAVKQPFVTTTNAVPVSVVETPAVTNVIELVTTNTVGEVVTTREVTITPPTYHTNYVTNIVTMVNPVLESALQTIQGVNSTVNPTPTAPFINMALLAVSGVLGFIARLKTVKAQKAAAEHAKTNELLDTVIAGVEAAKSSETKAKIAELSALWKTRDALHERVQQNTRL